MFLNLRGGWAGPRWLALCALVALLGGLFGGSAKGAPGANHLKVFGSVSGKTLTVNLRARPHAKCSVLLGSGKDRARLPRTGIGDAGRGLIEWPIPSSTPTGEQPLSAACGFRGRRTTGTGSVDIPESAVSSTFTTVLNILLYVFLLTSLVIFFAILIGMVVFAPPAGSSPQLTRIRTTVNRPRTTPAPARAAWANRGGSG